MKTTIVLVVLLLLGGCGSDTTSSEAPPSAGRGTDRPVGRDVAEHYDLATGPDDVVLRMTIGANQPDPLPIVSSFPALTLYGDGRLVTRNPDPSAPTAFPSLVEARLTPGAIQQLVAAADAAGVLDPLDSYGWTGVLDGDSTRFAATVGQQTSQLDVYDLGGRGDSPMAEMTEEQSVARRALSRLEDQLRDPIALVGSGIVGPVEPFVPESMAVVGIRRGIAPDAPELPIDLDAANTYETRIAPVRCTEVSGKDLEELLAAISSTEPTRTWKLRGHAWDIVLRPVLPDEAGCEAIAAQ